MVSDRLTTGYARAGRRKKGVPCMGSEGAKASRSADIVNVHGGGFLLVKPYRIGTEANVPVDSEDLAIVKQDLASL